jgi:hypothetical protein
MSEVEKQIGVTYVYMVNINKHELLKTCFYSTFIITRICNRVTNVPRLGKFYMKHKIELFQKIEV